VRVKLAAVLLPCFLFATTELRAEYIVMRSGQRLAVSSYQLVGDKYKVQIAGGSAEIPTEEVVSIEPEEVFTPVPRQPEAKPPFRELVEAAAARFAMDADLIWSVIAAESNFDPKAVSRKNARGLMQLLPETAARLGVQNIFDPKENIEAGTRYLHDLLLRYSGDLALALAAYNAGPEKVQLFGRVPPIAETVSYVRRVKQNYEKSKGNTPAKLMPVPSATTSAAVPPSSPPAAEPR
jgi:soluble lytic murein transglycosylase-like protein